MTLPEKNNELIDSKKHLNLCQLDKPAFKSLEVAWRSPLSSESPYDKEVIESLQSYLEEADKALMEAHVNEILKVLAAGFADQKGLACQEASLDKLDKFHTHSKAIENAFGHMDNLLRQTGPQGFNKAIQAMQIASAKDLVFDESHSWRETTLNLRREMRQIQLEWTESQKKLIDGGVKSADVDGLQRAQAMTKLIASLKKHDGPLNSNEEIDHFLKKYKNHSEKDIARMLNEEIRFQRDSNLRFSISKDCYPYKQRGISNELRVKNLCLLVQRPDPRSSATMEDLRQAIGSTQPEASSLNPDPEQGDNTVTYLASPLSSLGGVRDKVERYKSH